MSQGGWNRSWLFHTVWLGLIAVVVVLFDQLTKRWVTDWLGPEQTRHRAEHPDLPVAFEYVENSGAAFGLLQGQSVALAVAAVAILGGLLLIYARYQSGSWLLLVAIGLIVGGAVGNLVDRAANGYVVDFVAIGSFPRFNLADAAITMGVVLAALPLIGGPDSAEVNHDVDAAHGR